MLYSRAALLFGVEATPGTPIALNPATDALLVDDPKYTPDLQKIERSFASPDLSPYPFMIGRKLASITFKHELRGNGKATGLTADAPLLTRLFRACGFALAPVSASADRVTAVIPDVSNVGVATWAVAGAPTVVEPCLVEMKCTTAGLAAAAKFTITCNNPDYQAAPATGVAASAAMAIGTTGVTMAPTTTTAFAVGDCFRFLILPVGLSLKPVTAGYETGCAQIYFDGLLHQMSGMVGTFTFSADAGGIVSVSFTFWGIHATPVDSPFPANLAFEPNLPALFQDALVTWGGNASLVIQSMSFDLGLKASVRDDANQVSGSRGYATQTRTPTGGFNPETTLEGTQSFWGDFQNALQKTFFARVGASAGSTIAMVGFRTQTSSLAYKDSNNLRSYEVSMAFARYQGNDEIAFYIC